MSKKLYIIGNGFDVHHNIPSKYLDFKKYLSREDGYDFNPEDSDFYEPRKVEYLTNYKSLEEYDEKSYAEMFYKLIDKACSKTDWKDFEEALGRLEWEDAIDTSKLIMYDKNDFDDLRSMENVITEQITTLRDSCHILQRIFQKWITEIVEPSIELLSIEKSLLLPLDRNAKYLSFNYTSSLEKIYNIQNVCYIHGCCKKFDKLTIGHGLSFYEHNYDFDEYYNIDAQSYFKQIFDRYKKNTKLIIERNSDFFGKLEDIEEIYIYGKSISPNDVDLPYLSKVIDSISCDVTVFVHAYEGREQFEEMKTIISNLKKSNVKDILRWNVA